MRSDAEERSVLCELLKQEQWRRPGKNIADNEGGQQRPTAGEMGTKREPRGDIKGKIATRREYRNEEQLESNSRKIAPVPYC